MSYGLLEHRHRFASWAAARAAQAGGGAGGGAKGYGARNVRLAIEKSGLKGFVVNESSQWPADPEEFCKWLKDWAERVLRCLPKGAEFGRAVKVVSMYLKGMLVIAGLGEPGITRLLPPPVDSILIREVLRKADLSDEERQLLKSFRWTKVTRENWADYCKVLDVLRRLVGDEPLWTVEKWWEL